ncbi:MAG: hypothetical protein DRQ88_06915 [Epsilonproteobacteria bacterium]|nr:MAG: hypothetical protein DRQ89_05675 [Campylobacterota bacterium]RLA66366.1 MAG: hypothetical protein DRQ88_06915 [Campylobacterota bacterium]
MKAIFLIYLLLASCTSKKDIPLDEKTIISHLTGATGAKKWKLLKYEDLQNPESEITAQKKCEMDDELEYMQEGYFLYRFNEKCSKYEHDHAVKWRYKKIEGKDYIEYFLTEYTSVDFQGRALIEKIGPDELVLKYLKNEKSKKEQENGDWYIENIPIPGEFDYIIHLKSSK